MHPQVCAYALKNRCLPVDQYGYGFDLIDEGQIDLDPRGRLVFPKRTSKASTMRGTRPRLCKGPALLATEMAEFDKADKAIKAVKAKLSGGGR
jgi:hypothetical protein